MKDQLIQRIKDCPNLPSLPAIAMQVIELAQKKEVDIPEIARLISRDPALSSKILRTVNSSFYGRSQTVSTISHALVILGLQSVKTLVLGFSLVNNLRGTQSKGFQHLQYWRRSIYAATAARILAGRLQLVQQEECFLAALMADIGMLVLDQVLGEQYGQIAETARTHAELVIAEASELELTHADAAGILAEHWKLPPILTIPLANHHRCDEVEDASLRRMAQVVYLAGRCADIFVDDDAALAIAEVRQLCSERYKMTEAQCDEMLDEICTKTKEVAPLFEITLSSTSFDAILKKANETLVELTLRTQQQAAELAEQNVKLQEQATTDRLTLLANRASFDAFLADKFAAALATGQPIAMLMLDLDKFKSVNDTHGHQAGDAVLKAIGKMLRSAARASDLAARYGGEEMALILPGTSRATAAAIAESIRRAIAAKSILSGSKAIPVTVSIGVSAAEPGSPLRTPALLLKAADMAVYAAKRGGRNCVRVFSPRPKIAA